MHNINTNKNIFKNKKIFLILFVIFDIFFISYSIYGEKIIQQETNNIIKNQGYFYSNATITNKELIRRKNTSNSNNNKTNKNYDYYFYLDIYNDVGINYSVENKYIKVSKNDYKKYKIGDNIFLYSKDDKNYKITIEELANSYNKFYIIKIITLFLIISTIIILINIFRNYYKYRR